MIFNIFLQKHVFKKARFQITCNYIIHYLTTINICNSLPTNFFFVSFLNKIAIVCNVILCLHII